jgi:hypothetical protein
MHPPVEIDAGIAEQRLRVGGPHLVENRIAADHDARGASDDAAAPLRTALSLLDAVVDARRSA